MPHISCRQVDCKRIGHFPKLITQSPYAVTSEMRIEHLRNYRNSTRWHRSFYKLVLIMHTHATKLSANFWNR